MIDFSLSTQDAKARRGTLSTRHGDVATPAFMPVGSLGSVKGLTVEQIRATRASMILVNAWHLMLRPGIKIIQSLGGIHRFMNWSGPILSDSGGYQIFSLAPMRQIDDDGVVFRSPYDGSKHALDPEKAVQLQHHLGVDIGMVLDHCPPWPAQKEHVREAMERTTAWAERSIKEARRYDSTLFAIVQGGMFPDLRRESALALTEKDFPGYALGGFSVGEPHDLMCEILNETLPHLPSAKPRYLMGVGRPADIIAAVDAGVDLFDCVFPSRAGRTGKAFTWQGEINLRNAAYRHDSLPIEESCDCVACAGHSRAYLHHLFACREMLGPILLTSHNLFFYQSLLQRIREAIENHRWNSFAEHWRSRFPTRRASAIHDTSKSQTPRA